MNACIVRQTRSAAEALAEVVREYLRLDVPISAAAVLFLLLFAPLIPRNAETPPQLAAFSNDEPFLTMALDATLARPYGNPANYFDVTRESHEHIPDYWGNLRYDNIIYYGGALYQLACPVYAALRAADLPPFPTAPIILRSICLLAAVASLIFLYNFAKSRGSRWVGLMVVGYLATDPSFLHYTAFIHPDTLQLFFGLLSLALAIRHARSGEIPDLIAFGFTCGIVQGTKVGGPWLVPMAVLAVWLGLSPEAPIPARVTAVAATAPCDRSIASLLQRAIILGVAAAGGYFVSSPYTFVDPYYFHALASEWKTETTFSGPFGRINAVTWAWSVYDYIGATASILTVLSLLRLFLRQVRPQHRRAFVLASVLATSQFLWFAFTDGFWTVPGYLILAYSLMAVLSFDTIVVAVQAAAACIRRRFLGVRTDIAARLGVVILVLIAVLFADLRWYSLGYFVIHTYLTGKNTAIALNQWAMGGGIEEKSRILYDDLAYFDPQVFPNVRMNGGVLTWPIVDAWSPDYVILSSSLYEAEWYQKLIKTDHHRRTDSYPFSMRLYQDLLPAEAPGPTRIPGVRLAKIIEPKIHLENPWARDKNGPDGISRDVMRTAERIDDLVGAVREYRKRDSGGLVGPTLLIYELSEPELE
jgi:Dolichyl-phosphate-mannose-protein mannosyltransferase